MRFDYSWYSHVIFNATGILSLMVIRGISACESVTQTLTFIQLIEVWEKQIDQAAIHNFIELFTVTVICFYTPRCYAPGPRVFRTMLTWCLFKGIIYYIYLFGMSQIRLGKGQLSNEVTRSFAFQYDYNSQASCETDKFVVNLPGHSHITFPERLRHFICYVGGSDLRKFVLISNPLGWSGSYTRY